MNLEDKFHLLANSGYQFVFDRDIYCNLNARKCFSLEFVEDNSIDIIKNRLLKPSPSSGIDFYFNEQPPDNIREELEKELENFFTGKK